MEARQRFARALARTLTASSHDFALEQAGSLEQALERLAGPGPGLLVANLDLPDSRGLATLEALVEPKAACRIAVYVEQTGADAVAELLERGADDVFDLAIFDPRVLDQLLGRLIEKTLLETSLLDLVMSRDTVLAHRRERERRMHRLRSALLAVTLEPFSLDAALDRVLEIMLSDDGPTEFEAGLCFLVDDADGGCRLAAYRGVDEAGIERLAAIDLSDCHCQSPPQDVRVHFENPDGTGLPACQVLLGRHASYVASLQDHVTHPLGTLSLWVTPDSPRADDVALLVEDAARIVSAIVVHHRQVDRIRRLHQVIEQSPLSVLITDLEGRITYANPQLYRLTGYRPDEVVGHNPSLFSSGLVSDETFQEMWAILTDGAVWEGELINRKKDGELFTEQTIISPVSDASGRVDGYVAVKRDITLEMKFKAQLEHQATHDPLTDLANRGMLGDRVMQAINYARRHERLVVALLIDLDDFSTLNEAHGAAAGDAVLREVAARLTGQARDYDTVARLGNDEFIVILGDVVEERFVLELASKYLGVFETAFDTGSGQVEMTASMGVATYPLDSRDGDELLRHASMALARQRSVGQGGYSLFGQEMEDELRERYIMLSALRRALDPVQFELHYQPQVDPTNGALGGAEALLRWLRPDGSMVSPVKFIPLAESSGMIVPIGTWVLETACRQFATWNRETGLAVPVSVNVSVRQFREPGFMDAIRSALDSSGLPPELLVLELTESLLLHNPEEASAAMEQISTLGVRLAIDDFGTGYSSLSYLTNLPIHQLKVDRAFVQGIDKDPHDEIIVSMIISMAHNLGLEVVAEGAETEGHVGFLANYRCNLIQGYHYSRPLPVTEFERVLRHPPWIPPTP